MPAYEAKYAHVPSYYSEATYAAGIVLEAIGGDVEDATKLFAALRRVNLSDAPGGPVSFDECGHPVENIHVRRVACGALLRRPAGPGSGPSRGRWS